MLSAGSAEAREGLNCAIYMIVEFVEALSGNPVLLMNRRAYRTNREPLKEIRRYSKSQNVASVP